MLSHVDSNNKFPQLALQTGKVIEQMGKYYSEVKLVYAIRGNKLQRGTQLQEQVVIGKPGTMLDWCLKFKFIDPPPPKKMKVFVLDEADVMICYTGTPGPDVRFSCSLPRLRRWCGTLPSVSSQTPNIIKLKREEETLDTIKQYNVVCHGAITIALAMIFCHVNKTVGWLAGELSREGHQVALYQPTILTGALNAFN
uniref:DEAD-box helicase 19b n=1 Tax=Oncorhynchus kisutch TaxID=8019 RepID=A0A8C7C8G1_ONCKI